MHLGSSNYLDRYKIYISHLQQWRQQFDKLESVDLRYDRQIVVNPERQGLVKQAPLSSSAARAAMAAGVKPAALVTREPVPRKPVVINAPGKSKPSKRSIWIQTSGSIYATFA